MKEEQKEDMTSSSSLGGLYEDNFSSQPDYQGSDNSFTPSPIFSPKLIPSNSTPMNSSSNDFSEGTIPMEEKETNSFTVSQTDEQEKQIEVSDDTNIPEIKITLVEDNRNLKSPHELPMQQTNTNDFKNVWDSSQIPKNIETVSPSDIKLNQESKDVDFFHYDFDKEEQINNQTNSEIQPLREDLLNFDFYNTIRPKEEEEIKEPVEEKIELSKVLATKEHSEEEEKEHIIAMPEDKNKKKTKRKRRVGLSIYLFYLFFAIFLLGICLLIIEKKSKFTLVRDEVTLALHSTYQAEIIVDTKIQNNDGYEWASSDEEIASVDENGLITANGKGNATITIKSKKTRKKQELAITTIDILINSIRFEQPNITLEKGQEITLSPIINEDSNIIVNLNWKSENENIAKVDQNGHIVTLNAGETTIMAQDPKGTLNAKVYVTVKEKEVEKPKPSNKNSNTNHSKPTNNNKPTNTNTNTNTNVNNNTNTNNVPIAVNQITLNQTSAKLTIGETLTVSATITPTNATDKTINWTSSNANVATVTNGVITAKTAGTTTITASTADGSKQASINITVEKPNISVTGITLSKTTLTLKVGETKKITAKIAPDNATNKKVTWTNSIKKKSIEIVETKSNYIKVKGNAVGTATITVTSEDGNFTATCKITVKENSNSN